MAAIAFNQPTKNQPTKPQKPKLDYEIRESDSGIWKTYIHPNGSCYREFESYSWLFGLPLVSYTSGTHPETNKRKVAHGIVAVGGKARGVIAIGQFCEGYLAVGQFAVGRVAAIGQFALAPISIGQMTAGVVCISQIGLGMLGIHQLGLTVAGGIGQMLVTLF